MIPTTTEKLNQQLDALLKDQKPWWQTKITVCDKCFCASCWQGRFLCGESQNAGTVEKTVAELIELKTGEHPDHWMTSEAAVNALAPSALRNTALPLLKRQDEALKVAVKAMEQTKRGCSFPSNEVERAVVKTMRDALASISAILSDTTQA